MKRRYSYVVKTSKHILALNFNNYAGKNYSRIAMLNLDKAAFDFTILPRKQVIKSAINKSTKFVTIACLFVRIAAKIPTHLGFKRWTEICKEFVTELPDG